MLSICPHRYESAEMYWMLPCTPLTPPTAPPLSLTPVGPRATDFPILNPLACRYESAEIYWMLRDCGVPAKHLVYNKARAGGGLMRLCHFLALACCLRHLCWLAKVR